MPEWHGRHRLAESPGNRSIQRHFEDSLRQARFGVYRHGRNHVSDLGFGARLVPLQGPIQFPRRGIVHSGQAVSIILCLVEIANRVQASVWGNQDHSVRATCQSRMDANEKQSARNSFVVPRASPKLSGTHACMDTTAARKATDGMEYLTGVNCNEEPSKSRSGQITYVPTFQW